MIRSLALSKGVLAVEALAASLYAITADTVFSALVGALVTGIPTGLLLLKERTKDRAETRMLTDENERDWAQMVSDLLDDKARLVEKLTRVEGELATLKAQ